MKTPKINTHKVNLIYLIPAGAPNRAEAAIHDAALHGQAWIRDQMGKRGSSTAPPRKMTFTLSDPVVKVCKSTHPADWFVSNDPFASPAAHLPSHRIPIGTKFYPTLGENRTPTGSQMRLDVPSDTSGWYWINTLNECYGFGVSWTDGNSYAIYNDSIIGENQYAGGATSGFSGVAVLHGRDVAALLGLDPVWNRCREIGGLFHEILHTMGRPHPPAGPDFGRAIMGTGYMIYPACVLLDSDKEALKQNPLITDMPYRKFPAGLCPFDDGSRPPNADPHPRPTPPARPQ